MHKLNVSLGEASYDIYVGKGILKDAKELFDLNGKVFILTDSGVPQSYAQIIKESADDAIIYTVECGEGAKSLGVLEEVLMAMLNFGMGRTDTLVAVGGGVVGDLGGFAAATYMRGIDFYDVPTTLLSQVDSSIGGKVAVNLAGVKNTVGAFHQPKGVLIDTDTLKTLPERQISNGLAEVIKMAATSDRELFEKLEGEGFTDESCEEIIIASLKIKKSVVEVDEKETGLRKILNFGHTLGHGIEASQLGTLFHGECVALGMLATASGEAKKRIFELCKNVGLPMEYKYDLEKSLSYVTHDKKCQGGCVSTVLVDKIGSCKIEKLTVSEFESLARG